MKAGLSYVTHAQEGQWIFCLAHIGSRKTLSVNGLLYNARFLPAVPNGVHFTCPGWNEKWYRVTDQDTTWLSSIDGFRGLR